MPGAIFGHVALSVGIVVTDASKVAKEFASCDRRFLLRKRRAVFLDRGVQVQFATLPKLQNRGGSDRFGDGAEAEECQRRSRRRILQVGHAKTLGPAKFAIENDSGGEPRNAACMHETGDRLFDGQPLFLRKILLLSRKACSPK